MFILTTILTSLGSIIIMFFISKLLGNKQISELSLFDYINGITIGSIAAEMAVTNTLKDMTQAIIAMVLYGMTGILLSYMTIKSIKARRFLSGTALILMENGKIYPDNLKTAKLDTDDLLTRARNDGYFDLSQIAYAILETNGKISFLPKKAYTPLTPNDLGQKPQDDKLCINVILDGEIMEQNLRHTGNDIKWLSKEMHKKGFSSPSDIFLAIVDGNNKVTFYAQNHEKIEKNLFD